MKFGRVIGTLVATQKTDGLTGIKFLLVQPLDEQRQPSGESYVAADATAQAGEGDLVFVVASREAALAMPTTFVAIDKAIVGIVDDVDSPDLSHIPLYGFSQEEQS